MTWKWSGLDFWASDLLSVFYISVFQEETETAVETVQKKKKSSTLDAKIQSLLELICDIKAMEECVLEMKFDTRKAPLGQSDGNQQKHDEIWPDILF